MSYKNVWCCIVEGVKIYLCNHLFVRQNRKQKSKSTKIKAKQKNKVENTQQDMENTHTQTYNKLQN